MVLHWQTPIARSDVDVVDVCTSNHAHYLLSMAALEANRHVLCEKPVALDFRDTLKAPALADAKELKTKVGFTFRYSPGVQYAKSMIDEGFVGRPFIFNTRWSSRRWKFRRAFARRAVTRAKPGARCSMPT
jgi:predicted dehydrogenase